MFKCITKPYICLNLNIEAMENTNITIKNAILEMLETTRFLSKDFISKMLIQEEFSAPAITSFGMNSFKMSAPQSYRSP